MSHGTEAGHGPAPASSTHFRAAAGDHLRTEFFSHICLIMARERGRAQMGEHFLIYCSLRLADRRNE